MRIAVIEHHDKPSSGVLGRAFEGAGAQVDTFWGIRGDDIPATATHDALVILGGAMNAADDVQCPYFTDLLTSIREYHSRGRPVLGICLGAQLIARAFDAELTLGGELEFGYHRISPTQPGAEDPVLGVLNQDLALFQWHTDHYELPGGATRLATNEMYPNQAFRIGPKTYGCQFHFEADRSLIEYWISSHSDMYDLAPGYDDWLPKQFEDCEKHSITFCQRFSERWFTLFE